LALTIIAVHQSTKASSGWLTADVARIRQRAGGHHFPAVDHHDFLQK
jgi:hypothetical protein